jgi:hypothetical protein
MTSKQLIRERNKFRRNCKLTKEVSRLKKAWRVPGTQEAGEDHMYNVMIQHAYKIEQSA